jgi:hypothetical protein
VKFEKDIYCARLASLRSGSFLLLHPQASLLEVWRIESGEPAILSSLKILNLDAELTVNWIEEADILILTNYKSERVTFLSLDGSGFRYLT